MKNKMDFISSSIRMVRPVVVKAEIGEEFEYIWLATASDRVNKDLKVDGLAAIGKDSTEAISNLEYLIDKLQENK